MLDDIPFPNIVIGAFGFGMAATLLSLAWWCMLSVSVEAISGWLTRGRHEIQLKFIDAIFDNLWLYVLVVWFVVAWTIIACVRPTMFWLYPILAIVIGLAFMARSVFDVYYKVNK